MTTVHVRDAPPEDLLAVYLGDHVSGATAGRALARRMLLANLGTPYEAGMRTLARQIDQELEDLRAVVRHHGRRSTVVPLAKVAAAIVGERLGRLKLNGQLRGYSPLSRLVEIEGLAAGVQAKRSLWRSLQSLRDPDALPAEVDLARLVEQADEQLQLLHELHDRASEAAFDPS